MNLRGPARRSATGARVAVRRVRGAARAHGAGESGLAHLIEVHGVSSAGDALVAIGLAGSLFFNVPAGEARGKVALYLLLTMAPFAVLAPVIGPLLDRVRRGRRIAIFATLVVRGLLAMSLAGALSGSDPLALYPTAFGLLIASKAYNVARSAVVPRLLPSGIGLVRANSRITLAGLLLATAAVPLGAAISAVAGSGWTLRLAGAVFFVGAGLTFSLPPHVDSTEAQVGGGVPRRTRMFLDRSELGPRVPVALVGSAVLRALNGFLTVFLAFLLRKEGGLGPFGSNVALGLVVGSAALGGVAGTTLGGRVQLRAPLALSLLSVLAAVTASATGALLYGVVTVLAVALVTGMGQAVSKLGLDSLVQRDVAEQVRSSAFSLSESALQLSWVLGGILGVVLPLSARLGFTVAAAACAAAFVWCVRGARLSRSAQPAARAVPRLP